MKLNFHYFADARRTLYDTAYQALLPQMYAAGVETLWLFVYNAGKYEANAQELAMAKADLERRGFQVNALICPVGHPGNSLNPDDPTLDLRLPESWTYRIRSDGTPDYFSGCVNDILIADNRKAVTLCRELGIHTVFFDDDLRMGNHGNEIRGCFCDACIREFQQNYGITSSKEEIIHACAKKLPLSAQWIEYNCGKITRFLRETAVKGIRTGIMLMHGGGRYHGLDVSAIRAAVPNCLFRVGELHFDDASFEADVGHVDELTSIRTHMALIGDAALCYSESTVFPPEALSPENLVRKIELEISAGLRNIFLMSGTWVMSEPYWETLRCHTASFQALADTYDCFPPIQTNK